MFSGYPDKEQYLAEIERRLLSYCSASRDGYKPPAEDRHRLEGFMQAAVFMRFATNAELAGLMERVHLGVFGKSIEERRMENVALWQDLMLNYDRYDQPTYERKNN